MEHGFSILMFFFSGGIFLYAAILAITKDYNMLPYRSRVSVKPKNPQKYTTQLAKIVALTALAPAIGGLIALWNLAVGGVVIIVVMILALWAGTKIIKDAE